jgi:hypothetical protein
MMAKGSYAMIILAAGDLDGTFARLQASDAEVVQEPTEQPSTSRPTSAPDRGPRGHREMSSLTCFDSSHSWAEAPCSVGWAPSVHWCRGRGGFPADSQSET